MRFILFESFKDDFWIVLLKRFVGKRIETFLVGVKLGSSPEIASDCIGFQVEAKYVVTTDNRHRITSQHEVAFFDWDVLGSRVTNVCLQAET
jgi:hypothetical protein